ncbi:Fic family protein [Desulfobacter hydrogenophilus]|uniref:Fic family protein n=1 Tax=Desulfobacter hydrogenophilus TaxID=2291 RepID=A0A328FKB7_9BACT|nr:Fic family protein [Desulfobacter hydrogenophilus]NDY70584.1 Fic family protein [Desulfobacter hydrogenophilus]QBH13954.1 Fic family protein [Desulfobacter hydrogenophilus]RAM03663.1 Fic family protein [Desulfobacter hydrogenophilus]
MDFLKNLDKDLQKALITQLRNLWTHTSTAIEGNTLTLGETAFVLEEGLTVSGKPLKDHEEVVGHARAIELVYGLLGQGTPFNEEALFNLHKAVQTHVIVDIYKPVGGWKKEPNSTVGVVNEKQVVFEYAAPKDVPSLMEQWFKLYHELMVSVVPGDKETALQAYVSLHVSFVRIHPFFDGNGRMARLVANLPVLKAGLPPVIVPKEQRNAYIDALSQYHYAVGQIEKGKELLPEPEALKPFAAFCKQAWNASMDIVDEIHKKQQIRAGKEQ